MEMVDGSRVLRVIEFDVATATWTGRTWLYRARRRRRRDRRLQHDRRDDALVIERDQGAGTVDKACADPKAPTPDCFATPAKVKRIYKIEMSDANVGGPVRKIGYIDLLKIADPKNVKRQGGGDGFYDMPFNTIENVDIVDPTHIIVADDNNLPFSGRPLARQGRRQRVRPARGRRLPRSRGQPRLTPRPLPAEGGRPSGRASFPRLVRASALRHSCGEPLLTSSDAVRRVGVEQGLPGHRLAVHLS